MRRKIITKFGVGVVWILTLAFGLIGVAYAAGNIDSTYKYAWGTNVGWINFNPTNGGVTVYGDHLEGYAWAENIGWIRLGTCSSFPCTHANTSSTNYGVNKDSSGNLTGYAWGTNVGWIKFNPTNGGVTINTTTGKFNGYAWGENVGWIHFQNASPSYYVQTTNPTAVTLSSFGAQVGQSSISLYAFGIAALVLTAAFVILRMHKPN